MNHFERMREKEASVDIEKLRSQLVYDPETGVLIWTQNAYRANKGKVAGSKVTDCWGKSYLHFMFNGKYFMVHRVAWFLHHGVWPSNQIDHQDGDGLNNRITNLRDATNRQNSMNSKQRKCASGHRGVRWHSIGKRWHARIKIDQGEVSLGLYDDIEDAISARLAAEVKYGFHPNNGRKS